MKNRQTQRMGRKPGIDAEQRQQYRRFRLPTVEKQINAMCGFLAHRLVFMLNGDTESVHAASRAWCQDAIILATIPAGTVSEAQRKLGHLDEQLEGWVRRTAESLGQAGVITMLDAAMAAERARWGLNDAAPCTSTQH